MKRIYEFVSEHGVLLLVAIVAVVVLGCVIIPFFVGIGRVLWDMAINNPTAFM